jgi:hypothetical protein
MFLCVISNSRFYCNFTSNIFINLSMLISLCNHNKLCNKQQVVKTSNTKDTCKPVLVKNSLKFFLIKNDKSIFQYIHLVCVSCCARVPKQYVALFPMIHVINGGKLLLPIRYSRKSCYKQTMVFNISIWCIFAQHLQIVYSF